MVQRFHGVEKISLTTALIYFAFQRLHHSTASRPLSLISILHLHPGMYIYEPIQLRTLRHEYKRNSQLVTIPYIQLQKVAPILDTLLDVYLVN